MGQGHRDDNRAPLAAQDQFQNFTGPGSPSQQILEICAQLARKHAVQTEADAFRVADDASWKAPVELNGRGRLTSAERAIDPQEHGDDSTSAY